MYWFSNVTLLLSWIFFGGEGWFLNLGIAKRHFWVLFWNSIFIRKGHRQIVSYFSNSKCKTIFIIWLLRKYKKWISFSLLALGFFPWCFFVVCPQEPTPRSNLSNKTFWRIFPFINPWFGCELCKLWISFYCIFTSFLLVYYSFLQNRNKQTDKETAAPAA